MTTSSSKPWGVLRSFGLASVVVLSALASTASAQGTLRAEVGKPLQAASELLKAGKAKEALAKVREACPASRPPNGRPSTA